MAQRVFFTARGLVGLICLSTAIGLSLILFSFDPRDPSLFVDIASIDPAFPVLNGTIGGWWGATIAAFLLRELGMSAYLIGPLLLLLTLYFWRFKWADSTRVLGGFMLFATMLFIGGSVVSDLSVGGYLGHNFYRVVEAAIDPFLLSCITAIIGSIGLVCMVRFSWATPVSACLIFLFRWTGITALSGIASRYLAALWSAGARSLRRKREPVELEEPVDDSLSDSPFIPSSIIEASEPEQVVDGTYVLPLEKLYAAGTDEQSAGRAAISDAKSAECRGAARTLESKLRQFGIEGSVVSITAGPTVTLFSYAPATDVKVSRIVALEDDLALAIEARSLRVIAPMPGTAFVGFEVANRTSEPVFFADMVARKAFRDKSLALPLLLGKNITGEDRVIDLATQPHLLIAGSTGSGKSVALHTMIGGLLCSRSPDELRLVLVDPKRLEFASYADLAHLLVPIVIDGAVACRVLRFLTKNMEMRYQRMAEAGVRNIQEFHRVHTAVEMPYIVVIIDELADLMMVAGKELDLPLIRLAQMARAAGIHLIVATQRPSVDVLTGLVKVNFPARIAFKVASKTDARTILDQSGAERLLGRGDMLVLDPRGNLERIQGAFAHDDELKAIATCIKEQRTTDYALIPDEQVTATNDEEDPLLLQVVDFVRTVDEISISLIQRRFRIGYNRSARLVDQLEHRGVILPAQGGKMRRVARDSSIT